MLSFSQFLTQLHEMPTVDSGPVEIPHSLGSFVRPQAKVGTYNKDYDIHKDGTDYQLVHRSSQKAHMAVDLERGSNQVQWLEKSQNCKVKAHEFYHHLITKHGLTIKSDTSHSIPAMHTWKRLSEYPDIHMTHSAGELHRGEDWGRNYSGRGHRSDKLFKSHFTASAKRTR